LGIKKSEGRGRLHCGRGKKRRVVNGDDLVPTSTMVQEHKTQDPLHG